MRGRSVSIACAGWLTALMITAPAALGAPNLTVDTFEDTFDGSCVDGDCSLRDAIAAVDDGGTVRVPLGFYPLVLSGQRAEAGDLDLVRPMTIVGVGETGSFLDASGLGDRVFDVRADVTIRHLTLLGGSEVGTGGVVRATDGTSQFLESTVFGGRARNGGAFSVGAGANVTIGRSWISSNQATAQGGALFVKGATFVSRSTISGNRADGGGGAFVAPSGSLSLDDSTLSGNVAVRGGGLEATGDVDISSSTIAANRAEVGGAVLLGSSSASLASSSVFGSNRASARGPMCVGTFVSPGHNVADARGCGLTAPSDLTGVDPRFRPFGPNGGPTPTHALKVDSPAVGYGVGCSGTDQRGAPRADCDSGAYELVFCLGRPVTIVGTPGADEFSGGLARDVFLGLGGDDEFQGSVNVDRACGGAGGDHLIGGPGDDLLAGGSGHDELWGESGDDRLLGGTGADVCRGGSGRDIRRRCETVS